MEIKVRSIEPAELDAWFSLSAGDPGDARLRQRLEAAWTAGEGSSSSTFVAERDGELVGRVAYIVDEAASGPDSSEVFLFAMWLPWQAPEAVAIGRRLVLETIQRLPGTVRALNGYANPEYMIGAHVRRATFEAAGMPLFQEKEGFLWTPASRDPEVPGPVVTFRSLPDVGPDAFVEPFARALDGSLDRHDCHQARLMGHDDWARDMLTMLRDEDTADWLLAFDQSGAVAGYVLLGEFGEPNRGTILHIGVMPEARGHGVVTELLRAANDAARRRGFARVLSDVDVQNSPMLAAMERAGHRAANTNWHVWHHRLELPTH